MPKPSMKICWLHLVWGTKERFPYFSDSSRAIMCLGILKKICNDKGIYFKIGFVNPQHIHLLIDLPVNMSIESMMQLLKGVSSHEINQSDMFTAKFSWAKGYGAFSVSKSKLDNVIQYIMK